MKAVYKIIDGGYISGIGTNGNDRVTEITESEYSEILAAIGNKPTDPDGYAYKLRADTLEWELVKLPPVEPEPLTDEKALTRYANELTGSNDQTLLDAAETIITKFIEEE